MANRRDLSDFVGLPTTSACIAAVYLGFLQLPPVLLALALVGLGVLMVSPLTYPAGRRVVGVLVAGWVMGLVAIVGLVDVRGPAVIAILTIASWSRSSAAYAPASSRAPRHDPHHAA